MNWFFFLNILTTTLFTLPLLKMQLVASEPANLMIKLAISLLMLCYATIRGRCALDIKGDFLVCNSYPFYKKVRISEIDIVQVDFRKVKISTKNGSQIEVEYFWGIKSGISKKATKQLDIRILPRF